MKNFNSYAIFYSALFYGLTLVVSGSSFVKIPRARKIALDYGIPELKAATSGKDLKWFDGKETMKNYPEILKNNLCADLLRQGVFSENRVNIAKYCIRMHLEHFDKVGDIGALKIIDMVAEAGEYRFLLDIFLKNPNVSKVLSSLKFYQMDGIFNALLKTTHMERFFAKINGLQEISPFQIRMYAMALYHNVLEDYYLDALASNPILCFTVAEMVLDINRKKPINAEMLKVRLYTAWQKAVQKYSVGENAQNDGAMPIFCFAFSKLIKIAFLPEDLSMSQIGMLPEDLNNAANLTVILPYAEIYKKEQLISEIMSSASPDVLSKVVEILFSVQQIKRNDDGIKLIFRIYNHLPEETRDQIRSAISTLKFMISHSQVVDLAIQKYPTKENPSIVIFRPNPDIVALGVPEKFAYFETSNFTAGYIAFFIRSMKFASEYVLEKAIESFIGLPAFESLRTQIDQGKCILAHSQSIVQIASSRRLQEVILYHKLQFAFEPLSSEEVFRHPAVADMTNILGLGPLEILKIAPYLNDKQLWKNLETYLGRSIPDVILSYEGDYPADKFIDFRNIVIYGFAEFRSRLRELRQQELKQDIAKNFPELSYIFRKQRIS